MTIRQDWPALRERPDLAELVAEERRVGADLRAHGVLERIWRLPGGRANISLWRAADPTELHAALERLPLWPWLTAEVVPLAAHDLETTLPGEPSPAST